MIAFHVYLNSKKVCTAGVPVTGVLSAHVTWVRRSGEQTHSKQSPGVKQELTMDVGGLITPTDEYVRWADGRALQVGDEVRIKIVEAERVDRPRIRKRSDPAKDLHQQKRYVREMAKRFGWKVQT
jgi:DNA-directed RNA polymerase subunit E'/Rpb7